ncbi:phosphodiesterase [Amycolatopsis antarctica]|uniref:Phosphodiesterase n=1 Tax=Amycolatopsis antarctica TaxID=1854586 RepID=A0A263D5W2_9PSEU|nr:alkaline phosphatase D family protein [Amycolatopsis antarctica]OZM73428.1 phosphodiesterase [Amycolatopsis antarctica]
MTELLLGPMLRHVDEDSATLWVETSAPCRVVVGAAAADTFEIEGHHYAVLVLTELRPGTSTSYEVRLDDRLVWPEPGSRLPPSRIRTLPAPGQNTDGNDADPDASTVDRRFRIVFGSCRKPRQAPELGSDALVAYARRMSTLAESEWPESLLLLGDQVYADETTTETREWISQRRSLEEGPGVEVANFAEYSHLYHEAWRDPLLRWLMSTVPTSMIFDDHDVRDDWNTSQAWRDDIQREPWWPERIRGGFMSYWIYQHLGNLGPEELAENELFQQVRKSGVDNAPALREFADRADAEADGAKATRWSYRRDFGRVRLLVIDTRAGRILADGHRMMVSEDEFGWIEDHARGDYDHLLIGSTIPWLMPNALSHVQSANERACMRTGRRGRWAEKLRQGADLEHWPAFRASFDRLTELIRRISCDDPAPSTVAVLSGDVHHAYVAEATYPEPTKAGVFQLTCSPVHNAVPWFMPWVFRAGWWRPLAAVAKVFAKRAGVEMLPVKWTNTSGPHFGNAVTTIEVTGRHAVATLERAKHGVLTALPGVPLSRE